jgi:hypothetical protein
VRQRQGAAGRHQVRERGQQRAGIGGVRDEVEDGEQQDRDRLTEVDQLAGSAATGLMNGLMNGPPRAGLL